MDGPVWRRCQKTVELKKRKKLKKAKRESIRSILGLGLRLRLTLALTLTPTRTEILSVPFSHTCHSSYTRLAPGEVQGGRAYVFTRPQPRLPHPWGATS